jgi:hypothetical protein
VSLTPKVQDPLEREKMQYTVQSAVEVLDIRFRTFLTISPCALASV